MSVDDLTEIRSGCKSGFLKGSHMHQYATLQQSIAGGILRKSKSKARRHSAGQSINGALAG